MQIDSFGKANYYSSWGQNNNTKSLSPDSHIIWKHIVTIKIHNGETCFHCSQLLYFTCSISLAHLFIANTNEVPVTFRDKNSWKYINTEVNKMMYETMWYVDAQQENIDIEL